MEGTVIAAGAALAACGAATYNWYQARRDLKTAGVTIEVLERKAHVAAVDSKGYRAELDLLEHQRTRFERRLDALRAATEETEVALAVAITMSGRYMETIADLTQANMNLQMECDDLQAELDTMHEQLEKTRAEADDLRLRTDLVDEQAGRCDGCGRKRGHKPDCSRRPAARKEA